MKNLLLLLSALFLLTCLSVVGYLSYIYITEKPAEPNWYGYVCEC